MKSSVIPADVGGVFDTKLALQPSGGADLESQEAASGSLEESPLTIPHHPLAVKPAGNLYTASSNAKAAIGPFQLFPDEVIAIFLEYLDPSQLCLLGSTCKFLYAFCRSDDIWKNLFIEYVSFIFCSLPDALVL